VWLARVPKPVRKGSVSLRELSASAAEQTEKELILRTLNEVNWNRKRAAKPLNICYKSLLNKMHRWQLRSQAEVDHRESEEKALTASATRSAV
jgi:DNA-binding NtrC family response regulator